jgi:CheY-like chemotaxis protein
MAQRHQPDVILMDIMMPNLDGYSAIFKLKSDAATKHIPIVVLTALAYDLNKTFAEGAGANGYITKPFTQKDLLNTIGPLVKRSKQRSPFNEMVDIAQCGNSS